MKLFRFFCVLVMGAVLAAPLYAADEEDEQDEDNTPPAVAITPEKPAVTITPEKPSDQKPAPPKNLPPAAQEFNNYGVAVLQELDKLNARVQTVDAAIDKPITFGALEIVVKACRKTPPEDPPESAAYIEIRDARYQDKAMDVLFRGWMFASSPALSALEHPNYDVWVLDCKNAPAKERSDKKPSSAPKKASPDKAAPKAE